MQMPFKHVVFCLYFTKILTKCEPVCLKYIFDFIIFLLGNYKTIRFSNECLINRVLLSYISVKFLSL